MQIRVGFEISAACSSASGRDACDVALASTFGPNTLERLKVWTDEVTGP